MYLSIGGFHTSDIFILLWEENWTGPDELRSCHVKQDKIRSESAERRSSHLSNQSEHDESTLLLHV